MTPPDIPRSRPGGRSALVVARVKDAVEGLLEEAGGEPPTMPAIAARAGLSPSTLYRRWADVGSLVAEVTTQRLDPHRPLPDTGSTRADLAHWADELFRHWSRPAKTSLLRAAAAVSGGTPNQCLRDRRSEIGGILGRAPAGDAGIPSVDDVMDHVVAPIIYRLVFESGSVDERFPGRLVDAVMPAIGDRVSRRTAAPDAAPDARSTGGGRRRDRRRS